MLSAGVALLYCFFMAADKRRTRLGMKLPAIIAEVAGGAGQQGLAPGVKAVVLELCCNDTEGEDVEVPFVQYRLNSNGVNKNGK